MKGALQGPFDEAVEGLRDATGVVTPKRTAELMVREASVDFERFHDRRGACCYDEDGPILVAAIDSKGIPMVKLEPACRRVRQRKGEKRQKKRMSTVAAVFTQAPEPRTAEEIVQRLFAPAQLSSRKKRASTSRGANACGPVS